MGFLHVELCGGSGCSRGDGGDARRSRSCAGGGGNPGPVSQLISVGLAGACDPAVAVGSVLEATEVIDVRSGERFATVAADNDKRTLVTGSSIAGVREKARLFEAYRAAARRYGSGDGGAVGGGEWGGVSSDQGGVG